MTNVIDELNEMLGSFAYAVRRDTLSSAIRELRRLQARTAELERQVDCAEISLAIWDEGGTSEYWLRYPERTRARSLAQGEG